MPLALVAVAVLGIALAAAVIAGGGGGSSQRPPQTRSTERFAFAYPRGWRRIEGLEYGYAEAAGHEGVGENTFGLDRENWVGVSFLLRSPQPVVAGNIDQTVAYTRLATDRFAGGIEDGEVLLRPTVTTAAGLPALESRLAYESATGAEVESRILGIYDRRDLYAVTCQHERRAPARVRSAVEEGCALVLETFSPTD